MEPITKRAKLEVPLVEAADVTAFHLVHALAAPPAVEAELDAAADCDQFEGEFFHQQFPDEEQIKGYEDLSIDIWLSSQTYHAWIDFQFSAKKRKADDLEKIFGDTFKAGYANSRKEFVATLAAQEPLDLGGPDRTLLEGTTKDGAQLRIQGFRLASAPEPIKALHARLEPLLLFYVDGANYIPNDDPNWELLLAVQADAQGRQIVAGFCTVYHFYAYPDKTRLRVSQILVLPPYQGRGIGQALLQAAYKITKQGDYLDLTIEDPTPNLQRVREKMEVDAMIAAGWPVALAKEALQAAAAVVANNGADSGPAAAAAAAKKLALPAASVARMQQELKIHGSQAKCVWEVLLYLHADKQALPALAALLKVRLEAAHFASVARHAEKKRLQDTENAHGEAYIMYVMSKGEAAWRAKKAAEATAAEEKRGAGPGTAAAGASSSAAGEEGVELSLAGRGSRVESTSKEEKEEKLAELLNARFEEMEAIKSILGRAGLTAGPRQ